MAQRFNPPPNWPKPPEGFVPDENWVPDPAWGPVPKGWSLWIDEDDAVQPAPEQTASTEAAREATRQKNSKTTLLLGISCAVVLVLGIAALVGAVSLHSSGESQADSSGDASASALSSSSSTAGPKAQDISAETANTVYDAAAEVPVPHDFPAGSYREYTSDQIAKTTAAETDSYVFEPERLPETQNSMTWLELRVTAPEVNSQFVGSFSTQAWNTSEKNPGVVPFTTTSFLSWSNSSSREIVSSYWLPRLAEGTGEKLSLDVPQGSTWTIRIHPLEHAPTVSGAVRADGSRAFIYQPSSTTLYTTSLSEELQRTNLAMAFIYNSPTAVTYDERETLADSEFSKGDGEAYLKAFSLASAQLDYGEKVYIQARSGSSRWVISDTAP